MHQTKKGKQWFFGMKAHIGVDADSGLVHTVTTTAANEANVEQMADLLHGKAEQVWADSGYRGAQSRIGRKDLQWHIAARPSAIAKLREGRAETKVQKRSTARPAYGQRWSTRCASAARRLHCEQEPHLLTLRRQPRCCPRSE
jgi:IS5 family transposase